MGTIVIKNDSWMKDGLAVLLVGESIGDVPYAPAFKGTFREYVRSHGADVNIFAEPFEDRITYTFENYVRKEKKDEKGFQATSGGRRVDPE